MMRITRSKSWFHPGDEDYLNIITKINICQTALARYLIFAFLVSKFISIAITSTCH